MLTIQTVLQPEREHVIKKTLAVFAKELRLAGGDVRCHSKKMEGLAASLNGKQEGPPFQAALRQSLKLLD
jgi:hypothetical protein